MGPKGSGENLDTWKSPKGSRLVIRVLRDLYKLEGFSGVQMGPTGS